MKQILTAIAIIGLASGCSLLPTEQEILSSKGITIPELNTFDEVWQWVSDNIDFETDQSLYGTMDRLAHPYEVLFYKRGDCEDYTILMGFLLKRIGIESRFVAINKGYSHVIIEVGGIYYEPQFKGDTYLNPKVLFSLPMDDAMKFCGQNFLNYKY